VFPIPQTLPSLLPTLFLTHRQKGVENDENPIDPGNKSRLRDRHATNNAAWLKRFAISLLKQMNDKESIALRRRMTGWNPEYLAQVLGLSTV
jgi:hypothetical protein